MGWAKDGDRQTPWEFPEPASFVLAALGSAFLLRRR
ncbi:MAG: PEP-CTERM sorting domain-containing protein [Planctomycetes bacterium]|nr:PEP-CTERM sorting domain-containing protein [Planctomycetota bacterium]